MIRTLTRPFTDHPAAVDENYVQHMGVALGFAWRLGLAAMAALVHALIPALCERTASRMIAELHAQTSTRVPRKPRDTG